MSTTHKHEDRFPEEILSKDFESKENNIGDNLVLSMTNLSIGIRWYQEDVIIDIFACSVGIKVER